MTLDDLYIEFKKVAPYHGTKAGIRAVVEALRDEFGNMMDPHDDWNRQGIVGVFNEILGSDAGSEKAAGASARKDEGQDNGCITPASPKPAADPKDECVWTLKSHKQLWNEWDAKDCRAIRHVTIFGHYDVCPSCGLPITFKETANG